MWAFAFFMLTVGGGLQCFSSAPASLDDEPSDLLDTISLGEISEAVIVDEAQLQGRHSGAPPGCTLDVRR